ncbi:MAG: hypothetical protein V7734_13645 [Maribacter arcticus]|uniref:hypothetical protein n=1 Tax=Maribacter arcticus TaxID=561365 RepID=UPI0030015D46
MVLTEEEQWNYHWQKGTFLIHHMKANKSSAFSPVRLFRGGGTYNPRTNKIMAKGHFKTGETLDRYASCVDINGIRK